MRYIKGLKKRIRKVSPSALLRAARATDDSYVFARWSGRTSNWGDALNPYLINYITGYNVVNIHDTLNLSRKPVYSVIGSVLDGSDDAGLVVWGSGFKFGDGFFRKPPREIKAIRGPYTRENILRQGILCPEVYGDPALLLPRYYMPVSLKSYRLGIVAHCVDQGAGVVDKWRENDDVLIIDIMSGIQQFVDSICSCKFIASSSLHGLIAADAYGVPSRWIKISDRIDGGSFKFKDYYASQGVEGIEPVVIRTESDIDKIYDGHRGIVVNNVDIDKLLGACPIK